MFCSEIVAKVVVRVNFCVSPLFKLIASEAPALPLSYIVVFLDPMLRSVKVIVPGKVALPAIIPDKVAPLIVGVNKVGLVKVLLVKVCVPVKVTSEELIAETSFTSTKVAKAS